MDTVLALQGGGAHGAFGWGVLDRLLETGFTFGAVTGVSSGAMVAAMAVQGLVRGGVPGARAAMRGFWDQVATSPAFGTPEAGLGWLLGGDAARLGQNMAAGWNNALKMFPGVSFPSAPRQPNPLQAILDATLDLDAIRSSHALPLFVAATDVETGRPKIFGNAEITREALLASACLPMLFPAVRIAGRAYWDGGYSCNPALGPVLALQPRRLVLIRAQPRRRPGTPSNPMEIAQRLQEMAFQAPLEAALAALPPGITLTDIAADDALAGQPALAGLNTDRRYLMGLFEAGRGAAQAVPAAAA